MAATTTPDGEDPNKPKNPYANPAVPTWASEGANDLTQAGRWVGNTLFPSTNTADPNATGPGQDNQSFYQGLGAQRTGMTGSVGNQLIEGIPDPNGGGTGAQYVDPRARDAQLQAMALEQAAAEGNAPSAAEDLGRKYVDEGAATQLGLAATLQGNSPGAALRQGMAGAQGVYAKSAADAAALRAAEMATARQNFATTAGTARGQTQDLAEKNQASQNQFYLGLTQAQQQAQQAALDAEKAKTQNDINAKAGNQATLGKLFGTAGTLLAS